MGSGPTNPHPRVLRAMATGLVGQFDPAFTTLMGETQGLDALADTLGARARGTLQDALTAAAQRFDALARAPA